MIGRPLIGRECQLVTVTRQGVAVGSGSYRVRLRRRSSRVRGHESPALDRGLGWEFLIFEDITVPVATGDLVTSADGTMWKIYEVRGAPTYSRSLQVDLQRIPYVSCGLWLTGSVAGGAQADKSVATPGYSSSGSVLAYLEPIETASKGVGIGMGLADTRTAHVFTLVPIAQNACVSYGYDSGGTTVKEVWRAVTRSSHYPVTEDYVALAELQVVWPVGISF